MQWIKSDKFWWLYQLSFGFCNFIYTKIKSKYNSTGILIGCRDTVVMDTGSL